MKAGPPVTAASNDFLVQSDAYRTRYIIIERFIADRCLNR